ncbi:MAG: hypothetical protein ACRCS9_16535 [Hyphomicrobium sp.]
MTGDADKGRARYRKLRIGCVEIVQRDDDMPEFHSVVDYETPASTPYAR